MENEASEPHAVPIQAGGGYERRCDVLTDADTSAKFRCQLLCEVIKTTLEFLHLLVSAAMSFSR